MPHQCTNCGRQFDDGSKEMLAGCPECDGNKFQFIPKGQLNATDDPTTGGSPSPESPSAETTQSTLDESASERSASNQPASEQAPSGQSPPNRSGSDQSPVEMTPSSAETERSTTAEPSEATGSAGSSEPTESTASPESSAPSNSTEGSEPTDASRSPDEGPEDPDESEDGAQSDARSSVVSSSELEQAKRQMAAAEEERLAQVGDDAARSNSAEGSGANQPADGAGAADAPAEPVAEEQESPDLDALREELNSQFESIKIKAPGQYELNLMELYDREEYIISLREDGRYVIEMPETWRDED